MSPEHPASDHEMLCEIWEATRKMKVAMDEVLYRTALRSREEQEAHDQKVRAEVCEQGAELIEEMSKRPGAFTWGQVKTAIRNLAAPAASKPEVKVKL